MVLLSLLGKCPLIICNKRNLHDEIVHYKPISQTHTFPSIPNIYYYTCWTLVPYKTPSEDVCHLHGLSMWLWTLKVEHKEKKKTSMLAKNSKIKTIYELIVTSICNLDQRDQHEWIMSITNSLKALELQQVNVQASNPMMIRIWTN